MFGKHLLFMYIFYREGTWMGGRGMCVGGGACVRVDGWGRWGGGWVGGGHEGVGG